MAINTHYYYINLEMGNILTFSEMLAECKELYGKNVNPADYYELTNIAI